MKWVAMLADKQNWDSKKNVAKVLPSKASQNMITNHILLAEGADTERDTGLCARGGLENNHKSG